MQTRVPFIVIRIIAKFVCISQTKSPPRTVIELEFPLSPHRACQPMAQSTQRQSAVWCMITGMGIHTSQYSLAQLTIDKTRQQKAKLPRSHRHHQTHQRLVSLLVSQYSIGRKLGIINSLYAKWDTMYWSSLNGERTDRKDTKNNQGLSQPESL